MNEHELILKIKSIFDGSGATDASKHIETLKGSALGMSKAVGAGMLVAGAAVTAVGVSAVSAASEFTAGMSGIQAVTGATTEEMEKVRAKAMQIGADTAFSAMSASEGMEELLKAGVSLEGVLGGAADAAVALASAGGTNLATAAEISANAMNMFHMEASQLPGVADLIAGAANASAISVEDFGMSMSAAGAVAATAGFSFDDMAVAVTAMGNAGIKGSDAGTSLKTMMMNLIPTTKTQYAAFSELGIVYETGGEQIGTTAGEMKKASEVSKELSAATAGMDKASKAAYLTQQFGAAAFDETGKKLRSMSELGQMAVNSNHALAQTTAAVYAETQTHNLFIDETTGAMKPMAEIAGVLNEKMKDLSDSEKMVALEAMFGSDAIRAAAVMADQGKEGFDGLAKSMGSIAAADVAATRLDNFAGSLEAFKGSVETVQIQLGEKMLPALRQVTDAGSLMVNALGMFVSGDMAGASTKMSEGFASLGMNIDPAKFTEMFTAIQDGMARIKEAFAGAGTGIGEKLVTAIIGVVDVIVFLVEHPAIAKWGLIIASVVAAIAPIAAILAPIISTVGAVVGLFGGWAAVGTALGGALAGLASFLAGPFGLAILAVIAAIALWKAYGEEIVAWVTEWGGRIIDAFKDIFGIASPSQVFMDLGMALIQGLIDGIAALIEAVVGILTTMGDAILAVITEKWTAAKEWLAATMAAIGASMAEAWAGIRETIMTALEMVRVAVSAKWDAIKEYLTGVLAAIGKAIVDAWTAIQDAVAAALDAVRAIVNAAWDAVAEIIRSALDTVQSLVGQGMDWIEQKTGASLDAVRAVFEAGMAAARAAVEAVVAFLKGDWGAALEHAKDAAGHAWDAIKAYFKAGWDAIKAILNMDTLLAPFRDGLAKFTQIGGQLIDGLKAGISKGWDTLKAWLTGLFGDLVTLAKKILGIASPSKVFAEEVGEPIAEGMIQGLRRTLEANPLRGLIVEWVKGGTMAASLGAAIMGSPLESMFNNMANPARPREQFYSQHYGPTAGPGSGGAGGVTADAFRSGRGGLLAASKSNYWQVFVSKWGVPTEESARKVARQLGIPLPQWLEDIYNPKGSASYVDPMEPMKEALQPAEEAAQQIAAMAAAAGAAAGELERWRGSIGISLESLENRVGRVVGGFDNLLPILEPISGGGGGIIGPGPGGPIVIEPPPGGEVSVQTVALGNIVMGPTQVYLDGKEIARGVAKTFVEDVTILDQLGKALGKRKAATS